jgi:ribonucleotide reductase alpha subunit
MLEDETETYQSKQRVLNVFQKYYPELVEELDIAITNKWVGLAGGIWRSAENPHNNVSAINCTTLDQPEDNLESISEAWYWWAKFAAYGQGEGVDLSKLRPNGSVVHNSSRKSTGAVSFMNTFDGILQVIAQQGRRGASLISLHIKHPDIPEFIHIKDKEGVLESANISIHITDEFMEAVKENKDWQFEFTNEYGTITDTTKARNLFYEIAKHAWQSGDPGVQYLDNVRKYSNSDYLGHPVISTNACCLIPDTDITTDKGKIPIGDIYTRFHQGEGFFVKSYDTENNQVEYKEVTDAIFSGEDEEVITIEIETEEGHTKEITCTPDHQFWTENRGYIKAKNLNEDDILVVED